MMENFIENKHVELLHKNMMLNYFLMDDDELILGSMQNYLLDSMQSYFNVAFNFDINGYYAAIIGANKKYVPLVSAVEVTKKLNDINAGRNRNQALANQFHFKVQQIGLKIDNSKQMLYLISPTPESKIPVEEFLLKLQENEPLTKSPYNISSLSKKYSNYEGLNQAYKEARYLNDLHFFGVDFDIITAEKVMNIKKDVSVGEIIHSCERWKYTLHYDTEKNALECMVALLEQVRFAFNRDYFKMCFSYITTTLQTLADAHEIPFETANISDLDYFTIGEYYDYLKEKQRFLLPLIPCKLPAYIIASLSYINHGFYRQDLNLKEISAYSNVHHTHLSEEFTTHMNMTISTYIYNKRMEHAKVLLRETDTAINIIAEQVGYTDVRYFRRRFKEFVGETPTEYREQEV